MKCIGEEGERKKEKDDRLIEAYDIRHMVSATCYLSVSN